MVYFSSAGPFWSAMDWKTVCNLELSINIQVKNWNYFSVKASENANLIYPQQCIAPSESVTTSPFLSSSLLSKSFFNETFSYKGNDVSTLSQSPEKCQHLQQKNENKPPILSTSQAFSAIVLYSFSSSVSYNTKIKNQYFLLSIKSIIWINFFSNAT